VKPKYFIPVHGEYRHLFRHAALAHQLGVVSGEILLLEDGHCIEFKEDGAFRPNPLPPGAFSLIPARSRKLKKSSCVNASIFPKTASSSPIIAIDKHTGNLESQPEIVTRGFISDNGSDLMTGARTSFYEPSTLPTRRDVRLVRNQGKNRVDLKRYINKQTSKRPLILPVILKFEFPKALFFRHNQPC